MLRLWHNSFLVWHLFTGLTITGFLWILKFHHFCVLYIVCQFMYKGAFDAYPNKVWKPASQSCMWSALNLALVLGDGANQMQCIISILKSKNKKTFLCLHYFF